MIILMGVAGSGKSVQGRMLADELGLPWLSTGEFLRMLVSGERRKEMLQGQLLDDQEIIGLVQKIFAVIDVQEEFVLDGFPRTLDQADWLLSQAKHGQLQITAVLHLQASEEVVEQRLMQRARPDDHADAIRERFNEYEQSAKPILERFRQAGLKVYDIDGEQEVNKVHQDIKQALGA